MAKVTVEHVTDEFGDIVNIIHGAEFGSDAFCEAMRDEEFLAQLLPAGEPREVEWDTIEASRAITRFLLESENAEANDQLFQELADRYCNGRVDIVGNAFRQVVYEAKGADLTEEQLIAALRKKFSE